MRHANHLKIVDFQPGWDSLNWCQDVKSKMSFFSEIPKYLMKENTWRFYLYWGLLICKSRANLIFQVLPDYIWFLWTFALKNFVGLAQKTTARQTFREIAPCNIKCGLLGKHNLFTHPTNLTTNIEQKCGLKRATMRGRSYSRGFKNTGPVFNKWKLFFWLNSWESLCNRIQRMAKSQ